MAWLSEIQLTMLAEASACAYQCGRCCNLRRVRHRHSLATIQWSDEPECLEHISTSQKLHRGSLARCLICHAVHDDDDNDDDEVCLCSTRMTKKNLTQM